LNPNAIAPGRRAHWGQTLPKAQSGIEEHGSLTPAYFDFIRRLSIRCWSEWDRREIFEVEESG
jgi:hypothetical protein